MTVRVFIEVSTIISAQSDWVLLDQTVIRSTTFAVMKTSCTLPAEIRKYEGIHPILTFVDISTAKRVLEHSLWLFEWFRSLIKNSTLNAKMIYLLRCNISCATRRRYEYFILWEEVEALMLNTSTQIANFSYFPRATPLRIVFYTMDYIRWLFRCNGFPVDTKRFLYFRCNGTNEKPVEKNKIKFRRLIRRFST